MSLFSMIWWPCAMAWIGFMWKHLRSAERTAIVGATATGAAILSASCYLHTTPPEDAADLGHARRLGCMAMARLDAGSPALADLEAQQVALGAIARDLADGGAEGGVTCAK